MEQEGEVTGLPSPYTLVIDWERKKRGLLFILKVIVSLPQSLQLLCPDLPLTCLFASYMSEEHFVGTPACIINPMN